MPQDKRANHVDLPRRPDFSEVPEARRRNMRAVRSRDTKAELRVRRMVHALGYRYRLHVAALPGRPDIVFPARRKVIEVRGCFWHRHQDPHCRNAVLPATRTEWWAEKLASNTLRDERNAGALKAKGWEVLVVWECQTLDPVGLKATIVRFLGPSQAEQNRISTPPV